MLAPDFIGYGQSDPWPATEPFTIDADVSVLRAVAGEADGALHLVGHSYGAALALEAARTLGPSVKSLTLVEPVSFHLLRQEGHGPRSSGSANPSSAPWPKATTGRRPGPS